MRMPEIQPADQRGNEEGQRDSLLSNILSIVGFIIIIVIVIWGLVHLISLGGNWINSLSGRSVASISITAPQSVTPGEKFTVSWKYTPKARGTYAFLYQCKPDLQFKSGSNAIPCGAAYTVPTGNNSLALTTSYAGTSTFAVPFSVIYIPTATSSSSHAPEAQGSTSLTISTASKEAPAVAETETPAKTTTPETPAPAKTVTTHYAGPADLSVQIISVGVIDQYGNFVNRPIASPQETAAVEFDIANNGSSQSGTYYFSAQLPTSQGYAYTSPAQESLAPGDHIVNTLRFTQVNAGGGVFSVSVHPGKSDANEANNYASTQVQAAYANYNYTQPLYYTQNSNPAQQYPYNQYQPYIYQPTYTY